MSSISHVVFDIGKVLVDWDPRHLYRKVFEREAEMERFLSEVCTMEWNIAHDAGVPFEENAARLKARHPDHHALIDMYSARYMEMCPNAVPGSAEIVQDLKARGVPVHGLTNMPASIYPAMRGAFPAVAALEVTVVSGEEKLLKPQPEIYEVLIERAGLPVERTLYIDDSLRNVEAAEKLGMRGHHFKHADGLRAELEALGLLGG
ncbi:HAD family hydrolase [Tepidicaulis sp. LMO-SS28]|uniref:HAD family hydrolase n=1 Tax=Tepidicaulis sp. LMO-SS28 TaxID=3447455 RepID=UPI003EE0E02E